MCEEWRRKGGEVSVTLGGGQRRLLSLLCFGYLPPHPTVTLSSYLELSQMAAAADSTRLTWALKRRVAGPSQRMRNPSEKAANCFWTLLLSK
jgi:hypothetical protein